MSMRKKEIGVIKNGILAVQKIFDIYRLSPISIEVYDNLGHLLDVNQSCLTLFGIENIEEVKNFNLFEDPNLSPEKLQKIKNGIPVNYELEFDFELVKKLNLYHTSRTGRCVLDCFVNPTYDEFQNVSGYLIYLIEITERKNAEKELKKSEERFRHIVENSTRGMYFFELDQKDRLLLTGANPAADRLIKIDHEALIGQTIEKAFPSFGDNGISDIFRRIARGVAGPVQFDIDYQNEFVSKSFDVHVFKTGDQLITVDFTDITAKKEAERLLAEQAKELREINAMKDKFMSIIAHDLRSPFNAILGFSDLLLKNLEQTDRPDQQIMVKGLTTIDQAANQAYKLLENLLIWAQNQSGRIDFSPENLNLYQEIVQIVNTLEGAAAKKKIRITVSVRKEIGIFADRNMLDTIIRNLVSNSLKFSYPESTIKISASSSDKRVKISVADQGVGIGPEKLSSIFEIDKQTNTTGTDNENGTGLGLSLCKEFVIRHGGKIWAKSTFGKGSIFSFTIPIT